MSAPVRKCRCRRTIGGEFFQTIASVLLVGLALMCGIQTAMSTAYFVRERQVSLTAVLDGATAMSERFAAQGSIVTLPLPDEQAAENTRSGFELFNTSSGAVIFVADLDGNVLLHTSSDAFEGGKVPEKLRREMDAGEDVFIQGKMDGIFRSGFYIAGRRLEMDGNAGYLFAATPMNALASYVGDMLSMFLVSAVAILIVCSVLCMLLARRITVPIEQISRAARQLGSGDFTARAPVNGCEELADFATTFNNMAGRLQNIDNSRGQFMGNIAHELRTPMTSIKGFIDGMLDGTIPESEYKRYLGIVSQETGRLARLVQNMLDITKLESGEVKGHPKVYDIWATLTDVVLSDERRIEEGKIDIQGMDPVRTMVYADPDFVHQVVYNIVDNAIKFTPPDGVIHFDVHREGPMVVVAIENTGDGISPEALPFVFERFYKEDRSRGLNTRGSGLGLHICKVLITLSGGQIKAESEEGKWCRFTFTLPAAENGKQPQNAKSAV